MGQGIEPRQHHPTADAMSEADLARFLGDIRAKVRGTVDGLPSHMDYIRSYAPGTAPS